MPLTLKRRKSIPNPGKKHKVDVTAERRRKELVEVQRRRARGRMLPATWITMGKPLTEMQLLNSLVTPRSKIACIGGFGQPIDDPSAAYLTKIVRSKNVALVDIQDSVLKQSLPSLSERKTGKPKEHMQRKIAIISKNMYAGKGGLKSYRQDMKAGGKKIAKTIKLYPGSAWNTGIKPNSLDLIIDRGTWQWVIWQKEINAQRMLIHYLEILRNGGRIVFFTEPPERIKEYMHLSGLLRELIKFGRINVDEIQLINAHIKPYLFEQREEPRLAGNHAFEKALVVTKLA